MSSIAHPPAGSLEVSRHGANVARRNALTSITAVVAVALVWASAEMAGSLDFPERTTKAVIAAAVAFPGGPTLHRVVGFAVCATVLLKIPVVTNAPQRRILVPVLGLLVGIGLISAFFTNGFDVLRNSS